MTEPLNVTELFKNSPYTNLTGVEIIKYENGYSQAVLKITEPILRIPNGSVHGGAVATLVDVGMAAALLTGLKDGEVTATVQLQIHFVSPAYSGNLICDSKTVKKGKSIAIIESAVVNDDKLVAKAAATFTIYKDGAG